MCSTVPPWLSMQGLRSCPLDPRTQCASGMPPPHPCVQASKDTSQNLELQTVWLRAALTSQFTTDLLKYVKYMSTHVGANDGNDAHAFPERAGSHLSAVRRPGLRNGQGHSLALPTRVWKGRLGMHGGWHGCATHG